jgi:hypothetical protein
VRLESIRSFLAGSLSVALASFLLVSCGGGGAGNSDPVGGPPQILPSTGTLYAGVEYTFTLAGGRAPYFLSSSEPSVLPVPFKVDGHTVSLIPANTAVVDTGLPPNSLPVRTVVITMRDSIGSTAGTQGLQVAQNFLTGYSLGFTSNCVAAASGGAPPACAGGETVLELTAAINGNLLGFREYRFEVVRGPFFFTNIPGVPGVVPPSGTLGPGGATWTTRTDHEGDAHAIIRVNNNVGTQIGVLRVVDVATGASTQYTFNITGVPLSGALVAIPEEFTLAGPNSATCGTGTGDFLVFDGTPPYTAVSTFPDVLLVNALDNTNSNVSNTQPGQFRFSATNPFFCMDPGTIVVRDANNRQVIVEVTTEQGTGDPPPPPMSATPGSLTLPCGGAGSVILLGGGGTFTASSPDTRLTSTLATRVLTITRVAVDPVGTPVSPTPGVVNPRTFTVNVTDGTNLIGVGVTAPSNCPP